MARAKVDESLLTPEELAARKVMLEAARRRAQQHRLRRAAAVLAGRGIGDPQSSPAPLTLSAEEEAFAQGIISAALDQLSVPTPEEQLAALIGGQRDQIAAQQALGNMPNWYNGTPVTLFTTPRYERTRLADNDPNRPRIQTLIKAHEPVVENAFSGDQLAAFREYQDGVRWNPQNAVGVYQPVNRCLRGQAEPQYSQWTSKTAITNINKMMRLLDSGFEAGYDGYSMVVPENIITYRGIRGPGVYPRKGAAHAGNFAREYARWRLGEVRSDQAYVHTTLSRRIATQLFTQGHEDGDTEPYVIEYRVPAGTSAIAMNAVNPDSNYTHTVELLINRDTQFMVVAKYDDHKDGFTIHRAVVDILPPHQQAGRRKLPVYKG